MRKRVDWLKTLHSMENEYLDRRFFHYMMRLYCGKGLSLNRCAFYVLKEYYSTTTIADTISHLEKSGYVVYES